MNKVCLNGRVTKDPDLNYTPGTGTAIAKVTIAVNRYNPKTKEQEADFIPCTFFGKSAETVSNYVLKGHMIGIVGNIKTGSYTDKEGQKRYTWSVNVEQLDLMPNGTNGANGSHHSNSSQEQSNNFSFNENDVTPIDDDDIPF